MELVILTALLLIIFRDVIAAKIRNNLPGIRQNRDALVRYAAASVIFSIILSAFPSYLMIIYMRHEGFYAYELFSGNSLPFDVLAGNSYFNFAYLALMLLGAAIPVAMNAERSVIWSAAIVNVVLTLIFVSLAYMTSQWVILAAAIVIAILVNGYLYFWIRTDVAQKARLWYFPLVYTVALIILPVIYQPGTVTLVANSLAQMKVGGMWVTVSEPEQYFNPEPGFKPKRQWLVLRTNDMLYVKDQRTDPTVTVVKAEGFVVTPARREQTVRN